MSDFYFAWLVDAVRCLPGTALVLLVAGAFCMQVSMDSIDRRGRVRPGPAGAAAKTLLALAFLAGVSAALLPQPATLEKFSAELTSSAPQSSPAVSGREAKPK